MGGKIRNQFLAVVGVVAILCIVLIGVVSLDIDNERKKIDAWCESRGYDRLANNVCYKVDNDIIITREVLNIKGKYYFKG